MILNLSIQSELLNSWVKVVARLRSKADKIKRQGLRIGLKHGQGLISGSEIRFKLGQRFKLGRIRGRRRG